MKVTPTPPATKPYVPGVYDLGRVIGNGYVSKASTAKVKQTPPDFYPQIYQALMNWEEVAGIVTNLAVTGRRF